MNLAVAGLLAGLLLAGFARPRWWLSLLPVAVTICLGAYRLSLPRSSRADAVAFLGIVLLAVAMEGALVAGALMRAGLERSRAHTGRARQALHGARAIALAGVAFAGAGLVVSRAPGWLAMLLSAAAVAVVLVRVWRARGQRRPRPRRPRARVAAAARVPASTQRREQRRALTPREAARGQRRPVRR
jgi:hypothetical protein